MRQLTGASGLACPPFLPVRRYKYLHAADGDFHNPFDQGCRRNCREVCYPGSAAGAVYLLHSQEGEGSNLLQMEQGVS